MLYKYAVYASVSVYTYVCTCVVRTYLHIETKIFFSFMFSLSFDRNLYCYLSAEEGMLSIFLKGNCILLLASLSLRRTGFLSFFPSTSPTLQPWAHCKSSCYFSLILCSPLLIVPKPFPSPKVKVAELCEIATACVFLFVFCTFHSMVQV